MTSLPTTVADATAEAERVIEECREAGDESRLLSCIAATATYDPGTRRVRTYGPLNAALAWAHGAGSGWCRPAEDWERDGRAVARADMAVPVLVRGASGMALMRRYPYEATEGDGAVTEPVCGLSCDRRAVEDILSSGEIDCAGAYGMVEAYFGMGDVVAPAGGGLGQEGMKEVIASFKAAASAVHRAYEGRGGSYRPRRIEPARPLPVPAEVLAPSEVLDGEGVLDAGWDGYVRVRPRVLPRRCSRDQGRGVCGGRVRADAAVPAGACRGLPARGGDSESDGGIEMTVDGLYWDEAGRADVGMIEPGDTVYCICRGADGLFSVSSGVCVDPPVRFIDFGDGAQFLGVASTVEPSALRRFGLVGSVFVSRRAADRRAAELNAAREGER